MESRTPLQAIDPADALSLARTALDDPLALAEQIENDPALVEGGPRAYAIDRIDDALRILRDDHEPDELRAALSYHGQRLYAIAEELRAGAMTDDDVTAADLIDDGLDHIDEAIVVVRGEDA